jgi:hypothetical protein
MKKLIAITLLLFGLTVPSVMAQTIYPQTRHDDYNRHDRHNRHRDNDRWRNNRYYDDTYVVSEYRYLKYGRMVYKETYQSKYTRDGILVNRVLVGRERVNYYDNGRYGHNSGIRFNVFFKF